MLRFLSEFTSDRARSEQAIQNLLADGLVGANQKDIFRGRFEHLAGLSAPEVFDDVLRRVFNAGSTGTLHVENLSGVDGEIALRVGNSETPFGVINVGDDAALTKLCEDEPGMDAGKRDFSQSLFREINEADSTVNLLIGSKKFTEGWNSWRVATMGLLNVGRSEGSQIIQLFGRGVRLRGHDGCLKRSSVLDDPSIDVPNHVRVLETLGIFGVNADYMATFRSFLEDEGLDSDPEEILIPVRIDLGSHPLQTLALQPDVDGATTKGGYAFRTKAPIVTLRPPSQVGDAVMRKKLSTSVAVNWYPKLQARVSGPAVVEDGSVLNVAHLGASQRAFLDRRSLHADLERFKAERGWHNVNISRSAVDDLLADNSWYTLHAPPSVMSLDSTDNIRQWQQMAQALLRGYLDRYYKLAKQAFELPLIAYRHLDADDKNLLGASTEPSDGWHYRTTTTDPLAATRLEDLRSKVEGSEPVAETWSFHGVDVLAVGKHVYVPVIGADPTSSVITIEPVALDSNEAKFARELDAYADNGRIAARRLGCEVHAEPITRQRNRFLRGRKLLPGLRHLAHPTRPPARRVRGPERNAQPRWHSPPQGCIPSRDQTRSRSPRVDRARRSASFVPGVGHSRSPTDWSLERHRGRTPRDGCRLSGRRRPPRQDLRDRPEGQLAESKAVNDGSPSRRRTSCCARDSETAHVLRRSTHLGAASRVAAIPFGMTNQTQYVTPASPRVIEVPAWLGSRLRCTSTNAQCSLRYRHRQSRLRTSRCS